MAWNRTGQTLHSPTLADKLVHDHATKEYNTILTTHSLSKRKTRPFIQHNGLSPDSTEQA